MLKVRVVGDPAALAGAWQDLADHAVEPNPFHEPWMLLPALEAWPAALEHLFIEDGASLVGYFPLERAYSYRRAPLPHLRLWRYPHCFLGTPLVRRGYAAECLRALRAWLKNDLVHWRDVAADGPFAAALEEGIGRLHLRPYKRSRALLRRHADAESYIAQALPKASRKELRRLQARLSERGTLKFACTENTEAFLALEAAGWKGERGSALGSTAAGARFFRSMALQAAARGRLMMLALELDGRPVAMKCNLLAGEGAFAFKIAYDEAYARFSPGTLLELENIRAFHARAALQWMDSCAAPDHFMLGRLWLERRPLIDVLAATGSAPGLALSALELGAGALRQLRRPWAIST
jgi:CelD/BcsL family acetyltransferase involved in cellulose biosynthesis